MVDGMKQIGLIALVCFFCTATAMACTCALQKNESTCKKTYDSQKKTCSWNEASLSCRANDDADCKSGSLH